MKAALPFSRDVCGQRPRAAVAAWTPGGAGALCSLQGHPGQPPGLVSAHGSQVPTGLLCFLLGPNPLASFSNVSRCLPQPGCTSSGKNRGFKLLPETPLSVQPPGERLSVTTKCLLWREMRNLFGRKGYQVTEMSKLRRALFRNTLGPISIVSHSFCTDGSLRSP